MARQSRGRGTAAVLGMLLLLAGLVGGGLLFVRSQRWPTQAVEGFARAPVGCTTTLRFTETGTFFVFRELGGVEPAPAGGCQPLADPTQTFAFELTGPDGPVVPRADDSLAYDTDQGLGESVARVEITTAGEYELQVVGDDPAVVAAIGRDPDDGVQDFRRSAVLVAVFGVVLGVLLLWLAGRRSKRAAKFAPPDGAVRTPPQGAGASIWSADANSPWQTPVNPHDPPAPVTIAPPLSEADGMLAAGRSVWGPPAAGDAVNSTPLPVRPKPVPPGPDASAPDQPPDTPSAVEPGDVVEPVATVVSEDVVEPVATVVSEDVVEPVATVVSEDVVEPVDAVVSEDVVEPVDAVVSEDVVDPEDAGDD